jgi:tetratricopeptide (TPR) repeat protein
VKLVFIILNSKWAGAHPLAQIVPPYSHHKALEENMMTYTDTMGYAVSTISSEALAAYEQGVSQWLRQRSGAVEALNHAVAVDPHFTLAHCTRAYVAWRMGKVDTASEAHRQAMSLADHVQDEREHLHLQTVDAMQSRHAEAALQHLEDIAERYPGDRMGMRVLSFNYIARGDYQRGATQAQHSLDAFPDDPQFLTMTAFFLEQSNADPDTGLELGLRALAADPGNLYTYHAVGHNYQARGDYVNVLATFERANSIERYAHNLWHLAEAQAILGDTRLTRDYWCSTAPALPLFERIELQWRLEMLRREPVSTSVWQELATEGEQLLEMADYLTIWMHHWIGLAFARAGETTKAQHQLERLRGLPEGRESGHWSTLGAALLEGEMACMRGDLQTAVRLMTPAIQRLHEIGGGSREQKDIFQDVFLELQRRLGHVDEVIELAQRRLKRNPNHFQSLAALAWAYQQTGQKTSAQQTCQDLVSRAQVLSVPDDLPALRDARGVLQPAF